MRRSLRATWWAPWVIAGVLPTPVGAQERQPTTLEWEAPPECPQLRHVTVEVEHHLGQPIGAEREQRLAIAGKVAADASRGFVASIAVTTEHGTRTRELEHQDCRKLSEAAALVVALTIDPTLSAKFPDAATPIAPATAAESAEPPPPPPLAVAPVAAPGPLATPAPAVRTDTPSPMQAPVAKESDWRLAGALVGALVEGPLPELGVGLGARFSVERSSFAGGAQVAYYFPRPAPIEADANAVIEIDLLSATFFGCFLPVGGKVTFGLCPGFVLGDLRGVGKGVDNPRTQHDRYTALTLDAIASYETRAGAIATLGVGFGKTLEAPPFGILLNGEEEEVFAPDPWTFQAFLGFGLAGP